jgi:hypothetical protein
MGWFRRPLPTALLLVVVWTGLRLAWLKYAGIPRPVVSDEFSYLLAADTFAHGRLANPPHPLGRFFESADELFRPTYASKYPPGQALFLALGQRLFGSPFYGVVIGSSLMLFCFCLMLFAWVPYPAALAVSLMFALCLQPNMYWMSSYWGGSLAAAGSALVLLAVGVYRKRQTPLAGLIFSLGALLLFWTRPYEGAVFTIAVLAVFARELWSQRRLSVVLAALPVLVLGGAWTCYYNMAVTGSPLRVPYLTYERQYSVTPALWILPLRPEPVYAHSNLARTHGAKGSDANEYQNQQPWTRGLWIGFTSSLEKLISALGLSALFTLVIPIAWRDPRYRKVALVTAILLLAFTLETVHFKHYTAPAWASLALMIVFWTERCWRLRIGKYPAGAALAVLALLASPASIAYQGVVYWKRMTPAGQWPMRREAIIARLSKLDGPQLLIVRYPYFWDEWVYNSYDIDGQRVVLAHDLGDRQNRVLLDYYHDREVWILTFDPVSRLEHLEPYPPPSQEQTTKP